MNSGDNLQRTSARGFEPPFVEGKGAWGWLSPDTMRCVGAIDVVRAKQFIQWFTPDFRTIALLAKEVREQEGANTRARSTLLRRCHSVGRASTEICRWWRETRPTAAGRDADRQGRRGGKGILESLAAREGYAGLFVAGEDGVGIAQAPL